MQKQELEGLQRTLDEMLAGRRELRVLEAGCGSATHIQLPIGSTIVGIDISERQLARNQHLDVKLLGDIQTYPLPSADFDVIVCWDVLEHLQAPQRALVNFMQALKPGGLLVLALPNLYSTKGVVTKLVPHFCHILFYRYVLGNANAGKDDGGPFRTYLKSEAAPARIVEFATPRGLSLAYIAMYESVMQRIVRDRWKIADLLFGAVSNASRVLSRGKLNLDDTEAVMILRREQRN